jgi:hypothetical protein
MAILKSVVNVNNGNTGWTRADVMNALETAVSNLGWNGGTSINGSPVAFNAPGKSTYSFWDSEWKNCGGPFAARIPLTTRYFNVANTNNQSYSILESWIISSVNTSTENLTLSTGRISLETGDAVVWGPGSTLTDSPIIGLTLGTTYYVIKVNSNTIRLASTLENATNGIAVDITGSTSSISNFWLSREYDVSYDNYQIDTYMGDTLNFYVNDTESGGNFFLIDNAENGYVSNRILSTSNFQDQSYKIYPTGQGTNQVSWQIRNWPQTEDEIDDPQEISETGYQGKFSYGYANSNVSTMKGVINVLPTAESIYNTILPYWKYTVPATETKSSFKIKVYREAWSPNSSTRGTIAGIRICSVGEGWSDGDEFIIPGSAIGGVDGTNDILVGTNGGAVCSLRVTNYGAGSTMYQKHPQGHYGVIKSVNAPNKIFGTTYHGIGIIDSTYLSLSAGNSWRTLNRDGTNSTSSNGGVSYGIFGGDRGLDHQASYNRIWNTEVSRITTINYASTSTPTAYPLSIRVYRAQSPQDNNFAIIQFTQTINNNVIPYGTFTIHKGPNFGSNVWDFDYNWLGSYTQYTSGTRSISATYRVMGYDTSWSAYQDPADEPTSIYSLSRECNYGYMREPTTNYGIQNIYESNIRTTNSSQGIITYYRNNTYDRADSGETLNNYKDRLKIVATQANYYKPIKGMPIANNLMPCPYYIPDDFIMLQVSTTPGLTTFSPGDTVEISPSEVYEVILAGYQTSQVGLDGISNNSSMGMLFCGRII